MACHLPMVAGGTPPKLCIVQKVQSAIECRRLLVLPAPLPPPPPHGGNGIRRPPARRFPAQLLRLLRTKGPGNFTIKDIADAFGVSRRKFFNYFTSTEAAIASVTHGFLDAVLEQFRLRPVDEPILESARAALVELADPMTIAPMAGLFTDPADGGQAQERAARCFRRHRRDRLRSQGGRLHRGGPGGSSCRADQA